MTAIHDMFEYYEILIYYYRITCASQRMSKYQILKKMDELRQMMMQYVLIFFNDMSTMVSAKNVVCL